MKSMTLKLSSSAPEYTSPEILLLSIQTEKVFLGSKTPGGNIPALEEGDVPGDLWD